MRRAFTLVELMTVTAIILILATLSVRGISSYYASSVRRRCVSNLRVVHAAREAFFFQNPDKMTCPPMDALALGGYFRGKTEVSAQPTCPGGGTYGFQSARSDLQTVPTCTKSDLDHILRLYD